MLLWSESMFAIKMMLLRHQHALVRDELILPDCVLPDQNLRYLVGIPSWVVKSDTNRTKCSYGEKVCFLSKMMLLRHQYTYARYELILPDCLLPGQNMRFLVEIPDLVVKSGPNHKRCYYGQKVCFLSRILLLRHQYTYKGDGQSLSDCVLPDQNM